ncbi:MAG: transglutaminase domain-containing protein [Saprospiraceae bacterium]
MLLFAWPFFAQDSPKKFGKPDLSELQLTTCSFEPGASAMVLFDVGEAEMEIDGRAGFVFRIHRHKRIKLFDKTGLDHANVSIPYYAARNKYGQFEEVQSIKAVCHYLEDGKAKTMALPSKEIFDNDLGSEGMRVVKFAIPGVREGCVIEYKYDFVTQDLGNLDSWSFQGPIPVLHSEVLLTIPEMFVFQKVQRGMYDLAVNKSEKINRQINGSLDNGWYRSNTINADLPCNRWQWGMREVPSLRKEPLMGPPRDAAAHIEFQLLMVTLPSGEQQEIMPSYQKFNAMLIEDDNFGGKASPDRFSRGLAERITSGLTDPNAKARAILKHIQEKIAWNEEGGLYAKQTGSEAYESGKGHAADINLLLVACLRAAGISADPLILGTRDFARPHPIYPNRQSFNYVVAIMEIGGKTIMADATSKNIPLGFLSPHCLHAEGWRVSESRAGFVPMQENASSNFTQLAELTHKNGSWVGKVSIKNTGYECTRVAKIIEEGGEEAYLKEIRSGLTDWEMGEAQVLASPEMPNLVIEIPVSIPTDDADILYFKPPCYHNLAETYFAQETRTWPMDFPYATNFNYIVKIAIPEGYQVGEIPKDALVFMGDEKDLLFRFNGSSDEKTVTIVSKFQMKRTFFSAEEYADLRQFFNLLSQKTQEIIVFKKNK